MEWWGGDSRFHVLYVEDLVSDGTTSHKAVPQGSPHGPPNERARGERSRECGETELVMRGGVRCEGGNMT